MSAILQQPQADQGGDTTRLGRLERDVMLVQYRLEAMESRHESLPIRVTKLEQGFEHMAGELKALNIGLAALTDVVTDIGKKVARLLTVLMVIGGALQMAVPPLMRVWFP